MFVKYYQSPDGGLVMFEDYSHLSDQEAYEYSQEAHWDIDEGDYVSQGPKVPDDDYGDLYWYRWDLVSISPITMDCYGVQHYTKLTDEYPSDGTIRCEEHIQGYDALYSFWCYDTECTNPGYQSNGQIIMTEQGYLYKSDGTKSWDNDRLVTCPGPMVPPIQGPRQSGYWIGLPECDSDFKLMI